MLNIRHIRGDQTLKIRINLVFLNSFFLLTMRVEKRELIGRLAQMRQSELSRDEHLNTKTNPQLGNSAKLAARQGHTNQKN